MNDKVDSLSERINSIEDNYNPFDGVVLLNTSSTILGLGASFMMQDVGGTLNTWFPKLAEKLGVKSINKAVGSTNICHHANALYNGEILSDGDAPLSEVDAIVIMHAHNKDVFTLPEGYSDYSWQDYETNGIVPFETTTGANQDDSVYAAAFDYVIKKIYALYFAVKSDYQYAEDTYFGQYAPQKPAQIILCTHWHDARTIYNESIRKLSKKWGLPLIRFDDKIGFTKNMPNPNTGYQSSLEFVANSSVDASKETIDGVVYGWHQMRGDCYIQRKMSAIACKSFEVL